MKTQQNEDDFILGIWKMGFQGVATAKKTNNNNQVQCINTYSEWKERKKQIIRNCNLNKEFDRMFACALYYSEPVQQFL